MTTLYAGSSMKVDSFGAVPAARVCTLPSKAERTQMNDNVVIVYNGEQVSVPKEVADFLEQDRKRQQAQDKQDTRHLSKSLKRCCPVRIASSVPWRMRCSGTFGLKICGEPLRNWTCKVKTCSPFDTAVS